MYLIFAVGVLKASLIVSSKLPSKHCLMLLAVHSFHMMLLNVAMQMQHIQISPRKHSTYIGTEHMIQLKPGLARLH